MKEKSLNSKFDFYSSSKEDIINQMELYLKAVKEKDNEYLKRNNKLEKEQEKIEEQRNLLNSEHQEIKYKINSNKNELRRVMDEYNKIYNDKRNNVNKKKEKSKDHAGKIILYSIFLLLIGLFLGIDLFQYGSLIAIPVSIVYKKIILKLYDKKIELIWDEQNNEKDEKRNYYNGIIKELHEEDYEIRQRKSKASKIYSQIRDEKIELLELQINDDDIIRKKFNIPTDMIGYENYIYDLLKTNRVSSFNEALDRLELRKHRDKLERGQLYQLRMQEDQFRQIEEQEEYFRNELEKLSEENIQMNKEISNQISNQIRQQEILINEAKRAAENAEYAAINAENAVRR